MKLVKILSNQYFWLGLVLIIAFLVRLYKIDSPIADWHSWRQADTAAVTRNFIKEGFNPLLPKYDDMSGVAEKPIANLARFRFVEFPIYNIVVYPFYLIFGVSEIYHRLVSVLFSVGSIIFLYLIARKYTNIITAQIAAFIFALLPFNVFFSRTTLPEPTFIFFALGMVYFVDKWIWERRGDLPAGRQVWGIWGMIFTALAFLIKPWAIFFFLPLLYSVWKIGDKSFFFKKFIPFALLSLLPFIFWRLWILQQAEGIPATSWLFNSDGIRFRPAFFWWIISERIGREILGVAGAFLFFLGLVIKPKNGSPREAGSYFLHFWFLSHMLFIIIFATGNVRHDYYQILFVPIAAIFVAKGFIHLFESSNNFIPRIWTIILAASFLPLTFYFGWKQVSGLYQINNYPIVEAGMHADRILPKDAYVVAPYNGDTAFLYQANRPGWAFVPTSVKDLIADYGVTHYISTTLDLRTAWVIRHFQVLEQTPNFVILDLTRLTKNFDNKLDPEPR